MSYVQPGTDLGQAGYRTPDGGIDLAAFHSTHDPLNCVLQDVRGSATRCSHVYGPDPARWDSEGHSYMAARTARWRHERGLS